MKSATIFLSLTAMLVLGLVKVSAHHPFSATYLIDEKVTIEGDVVEVLRRNPHSFVYVTARDQNDHMRQWAVECPARQRPNDPEVPMDTLMVGDHVVLTGSPGRDPSTFRILLATITRPKDGWRWADTAR